MPSAQGHITVRRRAKDGTDGNDAVRYWVIPSATQIKRAQDGTMYPATVTCEKRKQTGNAAPVVTNEGTLYYQIGYEDGSVTGKSIYGSTGVRVTKAMTWIKFILEVSQVEVASETVSVVADGRSVSGVKEWYLRWAQSSGVTTNTGGWSQTVPQLTQTYKYLWNYEEISFDDGTTMKTSPAIIGVYGRGIKSVTNYYLATTLSSGVTTTTAGWTTTVQSPTPEKRYLWNYEVVTYDDDSTTTTTPHIICVYGEKGDPGEDAYLLDLDNEVEGIPCNSAGNPTGTGTLASTNSTVYKGSKADTGWSFTKEDTNCTSSIDSNGKVSVTAITADKASVKVTATKGSTTLTATMSLYKVKPGSNGSSPVVYSLEISDSAISRDADGNLSPASITVYKNKTTGSSKSRTSDHTLTYQRIGQDANPITISGQGGTINNISAACTAIELKLKNGTTVLDAERVPIVKDGQDGINGEDAITILVSPENIEFNLSNSVIKQTVKVNAYKGKKKLSYEENEFVCSTLPSIDSNRTIVTGLKWNFEVDGADFYYTFMYIAGNDINTTIPFTVTVDSVKYERAIYVHTVKNGSRGQQGIQGCVYRRSKHVNNFEYHNDSALTTDGIRYIDLVYIMKDSTMYASHALWFRCKKTHTSDANNAPQKTNTGNEAWLEYWEPMNTLEPLYTPFLLADDAVITLMQSNQILIANDEGVITAGMSGSLAGSKIRIWAGSQTPDSAPFRVDVNGKLISTEADIKGKITATSGSIAGFNISGTSLTNGPDFSNDACIIFRNDTHKTFAGIGGNVLPATSGNRAVARFENEDQNNFWGLGRNIAMLLSAKNGDINHAFLGSGNGNLDGWIGGYHYSKYTLNSSNTIYNGYLKISQNNKWVIYAIGSSSGITLPTLTEVRNALGIGSTTAFCVEFTIIADLHSQNNFNVYGRCKKEVNVNGSTQTPYFTGEYPTMTHWNNGRYDSLEMGAGDSVVFLLIYDPNKTGVLDTSYSLMYTARIINRLN